VVRLGSGRKYHQPWPNTSGRTLTPNQLRRRPSVTRVTAPETSQQRGAVQVGSHQSATQAPLELVRGFAKAIQESTPEAQREVVQRVFQRIAITDDRVTDVDVYAVYAEALTWYWRPRADSNRRSQP
jgi:hypothetical protein